PPFNPLSSFRAVPKTRTLSATYPSADRGYPLISTGRKQMTTTKLDRRKFLKGGAVAAGAAAATVAMPNVSRAQTTTIKMQSSWPASDIFQEMAAQYAKRATDMAGGRLKIDLLPDGAVVKAFQ